ncbi:MAG: site-specific integrase [Rhodobacteraceae bacterium]|nr:site-specific integrase [Paracoccaceae bacterium]
MNEKHTFLGGKVHVYKRENSSVWQCSSFLEGRNRRTSTREVSLAKAKDFAEDWYLELRNKKNRGELLAEKTFGQAADRFVKEYDAMTGGTRNKDHVRGNIGRIRNHLLPYLGGLALSQVTTATVQDYRLFRLSEDPNYQPPSPSTMHKEIVTLRLVLKTAIRQGWLAALPDLSAPYKSSNKVAHRAWFSPEDYKVLYTATRENARRAEVRPWRHTAAQLHDMVLFMTNTGIRPDEANRLEYRDVEIVRDEESDQTILEIVVRGKRGVGYCKSMTGAVLPFQRLVERNNPAPTDLIFPQDHKKQFNRILDEIGLKFDREGNRRTLYSLRHSYISFRLLEGADIYQVAKNCRTSVEMIEKHYAVHLKNNIDAAAINVRKKRKSSGV